MGNGEALSSDMFLLRQAARTAAPVAAADALINVLRSMLLLDTTLLLDHPGCKLLSAWWVSHPARIRFGQFETFSHRQQLIERHSLRIAAAAGPTDFTSFADLLGKRQLLTDILLEIRQHGLLLALLPSRSAELRRAP